jgi:hypothetical protein
MAYLKNSRPDIAAEISFMAQITTATFPPPAVRRLNFIINHLHNTSVIRLHYPGLHINSLQLVTYCNASFANRDDGSSQLGYVIILCEKHGQGSLLHYSSLKSRRVCRSALIAEKLACVDSLDASLLLKRDLEILLVQEISLLLLAHSQSLFHIITRRRDTTEKRLMLDIQATRKSYYRHGISHLGLIHSAYNIADAFTKPLDKSNTALWNFLRANRCSHPIVEYVVSQDERLQSSAQSAFKNDPIQNPVRSGSMSKTGSVSEVHPI